MANGVRLAAPSSEASEGDANAGGLETSAVLEVARQGERKTVEHRYGTIDEHMTAGEPLALTLTCASMPDRPESGTATASDGNERQPTEVRLPEAGPVHLGGVTLLSDYLLVARGEDGELLDALMRLES